MDVGVVFGEEVEEEEVDCLQGAVVRVGLLHVCSLERGAKNELVTDLDWTCLPMLMAAGEEIREIGREEEDMREGFVAATRNGQLISSDPKHQALTSAEGLLEGSLLQHIGQGSSK